MQGKTKLGVDRIEQGNIPSKAAGDTAIAEAVAVLQHPLSIEGCGVHPYDRGWQGCNWGLPEALAWIATRDLGIVAGVVSRLKDDSRSYEDQAKEALALLEQHPHHQPSDIDGIPPAEALRFELQNKRLKPGADFNGVPYTSRYPISEHVWFEGEFRFSEHGSWWPPDPAMSAEWTNFRFARGDFMRVFPPVQYDEKPPKPSGHWIDGFEGLTWETYGHAFTMAGFREEMRTGKGLSLQHHLLCFDGEWRAWGDRFEPMHCPIRARPVINGKTEPEQTMKFKFATVQTDLVWVLDDLGLPIDLSVRPRQAAFANGWPPAITELLCISFLRDKLGKPPERQQGVPIASAAGRRKFTAAARTLARRQLEHILRTEPPRSRSKKSIQEELGLTDRQFRNLWEEVAPNYPRWRDPGAPQKS
jgi:hypothetical protein